MLVDSMYPTGVHADRSGEFGRAFVAAIGSGRLEATEGI